MRRLAALALIIFGLISAAPAAADHGVAYCGNRTDHGSIAKACLAVASPFVSQYVKPGGLVTWCVDARASAYPGFVSQLATTMAQYAADLHYTQRQVDMPVKADGSPDPASLACVIRNTMPETHGCPACAAWVYTQNLPILIEYNWRTAITYWYSTDGHELGHANCLIDEFYDQAGFRSYILTYGTWIHGYPTVMDVGTFNLPEYAPYGITSLTAGDKDRCSETLGRDVSEHAITCGLGDPDQYGNRWDSCAGKWINAAGWTFDPSSGAWADPKGNVQFYACNADRLRWAPQYGLQGSWTIPGVNLGFDPALGSFVIVPAC